MEANNQLPNLNQPCSCKNLSKLEYLGMDENYSEVSIAKCLNCGQHWLHYFYENEAFSGSGRWYQGAISAQQALSLDVNEAKSILEELQWYFYGGSYFYGKTGKASGKITI